MGKREKNIKENFTNFPLQPQEMLYCKLSSLSPHFSFYFSHIGSLSHTGSEHFLFSSTENSMEGEFYFT
jgi:hypothetical protein